MWHSVPHSYIKKSIKSRLPGFQTETDIRYSGQNLALHQVADTHVQRVAFLHLDVRKNEVILKKAYSPAFNVALIVVQTAVKSIGKNLVPGFNNPLDEQAYTRKRELSGYSQTDFLPVNATAGKTFHGVNHGVILLPTFYWSWLELIIDNGFVACRQGHR